MSDTKTRLSENNAEAETRPRLQKSSLETGLEHYSTMLN